jgi:hypothetical protein
VDVVKSEHVIRDSEYLETLLVAVSKYVASPILRGGTALISSGIKSRTGTPSTRS